MHVSYLSKIEWDLLAVGFDEEVKQYMEYRSVIIPANKLCHNKKNA